MQVTISYTLSSTGQKASILAGGDGKAEQSIEVTRDDSCFARALDAAEIDDAGKATLSLRPAWNTTAHTWDHAPTVQELLDDMDARTAAKAEEERVEREATREATLTVLRERRTTKISGYGVEARQLKPDWPYPRDTEVIDSDEAMGWLADLKTANEMAQQQWDAEQATAAAAKEAAEAKAEAKEQARRDALGLEDDDEDLTIENGALTQVPPGMWTTHKRGRNWFAVIGNNPAAPGGLDRDFATKAKGSSYYLLPDLNPGDPVEFAADYYSGSGRKSPDRWHGYVVRVIPEADGKPGSLIVRHCDEPKTAIKQGAKFAASLTPMATA